MVMDAAALRLADLESRRICRFCLRSCARDDGLAAIGKDMQLVSRIGFALTLEVAEQDGLPQRICSGCQWITEKFYRFKDQCVRAEMLLKTFAESGMPLMQYFEPIDLTEFRWKGKCDGLVDVAIHVGGNVSKTVSDYDTEGKCQIIAPEMIKQEDNAEDWNLEEELYLTENLDQNDEAKMDEIARQLYETEATHRESNSAEVADASGLEGFQNMAELITEMDIGSPQLATGTDIDLFEDISNDTVEFEQINLSKISSTEKQTNSPIKPISLTEEILLLMKDGGTPESVKPSNASPNSPSDVIYEGIPTTPLCESDGLPARFVDMEPGEIISDDEYDAVIIISSDTEDNPSEESNPPVVVVSKDGQYQCQKCNKSFPQTQLLEAHTKAYHLPTSEKSGPHGTMARKLAAGMGTPRQKMAIMIDNPVKKCPKCGIMVHTASYSAHMRSHRPGAEPEPVMNYEQELIPSEELWDS